MVQDPAQHNHLLPRDFPSRLARAREERARFVSLSLCSWHVSVEATRAAPEAPLPQPRPSHSPAMHACQCRDRRRFVLRRMPGQSAKAGHLRAASARLVPDPRGQIWGALGMQRSIPPGSANAEGIAWSCRLLERETTGSCPSGAHLDLTPFLGAKSSNPRGVAGQGG